MSRFTHLIFTLAGIFNMERCIINKNLFFILLIFYVPVRGQTDSSEYNYYNSIDMEKHFSLFTGAGIQRSVLLDLGLSLNEYGRVGYHPFAKAVYISSEIVFQSKLIIGPKIGIYVGGGSGGMAMGLMLIDYTDFKNSTYYFRPEIGMGVMMVKLTYGYNIRLNKTDPFNVNRHNFSINILFSLKKIGKEFIQY